MTIMGFSRLLKVLSENTDRRLKLLEEYFVPQTDDSYYDFHASMKRSARQVCDGASDFPLEIEKSKFIKREPERKACKTALQNLQNWEKKTKPIYVSRPKNFISQLSMHGLSVRLSPEIAYRKDSAQFILQLWNTANPPLSKCAANVGLQLMRNAFSSDKHGIYNCGIIDLKKNKIYFPKLANSEANALLSAELLSINHLWKHLLKQANTPKGSVIAPSPLLGDQP